MKAKLLKNSKSALSFFLPPILLALAGILIYFVEAAGYSTGYYFFDYVPYYIFAAAFCAVVALMYSRFKEKVIMLLSLAAVVLSVAAFINGYKSISYSSFSSYIFVLNTNVIACFSMLGLGQLASSIRYKWYHYLLFAVPVVLTVLQTGFEEMFIITMTLVATFSLIIVSDSFVRKIYIYIILAAVCFCLAGTLYIAADSNVAVNRIVQVILHIKNGLIFDCDYSGFGDDLRSWMDAVIVESSFFPNALTGYFRPEQIGYIEKGFYFLPKLLAVYGWGVFLIISAVVVRMLKAFWSMAKKQYIYDLDKIIVKIIAVYFTVRTVLAYLSFFCLDKVVTPIPFTSPSLSYLIVDFTLLGIFFAICRPVIRYEKNQAKALETETEADFDDIADCFDSFTEEMDDISNEQNTREDASSEDVFAEECSAEK